MAKKATVKKPAATKNKLTPRAEAATTEPTVPNVSPKTFNKEVKVPEPTAEQAKARAQAMVVRDHNSRTAIELRRDGKDVIYIPNETDQPFRVERCSTLAFDQRFKPVMDYPVGRAARLCVGYALNSGATNDALAELAKLVLVTDQEREMAQAKTVNTTKAPTPGSAAAKAVATKITKPKAASASSEPKKPKAAGRFQELIMEGKLTDGEIFKTVQKEFSLSDNKRYYVSWYRNYLRRQGQNPPAPKAKEAGEAPTKAAKAPVVKAKPEAKKKAG